MKERFIKYLFEQAEKRLGRIEDASDADEVARLVEDVREVVSELKTVVTEIVVP